MARIDSETPSAATRSGHTLLQLITSPSVDRAIAFVAILPFVYVTYVRFTQGLLNIPRAGAVLTSLLLIATMLARRPPVRVTPNPWYWLLAFVATYGTLGPALFAQRGVPLTPTSVSNIVALVSLGITLYARVRLGRNIGFVPAQRRIVTDGAYGFVRHPIYTGIFVAYLGLMLRAYSPVNLAMVVIVSGCFIAKSFIEENFLRSDPSYAAYLKQVRYRWVPWIA